MFNYSVKTFLNYQIGKNAEADNILHRPGYGKLGWKRKWPTPGEGEFNVYICPLPHNHSSINLSIIHTSNNLKTYMTK